MGVRRWPSQHVVWIGQKSTRPWSVPSWALEVDTVALAGMLSQAKDMGGWGQESGILVSALSLVISSHFGQPLPVIGPLFFPLELTIRQG